MTLWENIYGKKWFKLFSQVLFHFYMPLVVLTYKFKCMRFFYMRREKKNHLWVLLTNPSYEFHLTSNNSFMCPSSQLPKQHTTTCLLWSIQSVSSSVTQSFIHSFKLFLFQLFFWLSTILIDYVCACIYTTLKVSFI